MTKKITTWLAILISTILVASLVLQLDLAALRGIMATISMPWLLVALLPLITEVSFKAFRQKIITDALGHISLRDAFSVTLVGFAFGGSTPGRVGDLAKIHLLAKKSSLEIPHALALGVFEKVIDLITLFIIVFAGLGMLALRESVAGPLVYLLLFIALGSAGMAVFLHKGFVMRFIVPILERILPARYEGFIHSRIEHFFTALAVLRDHKKATGLFVLLAMLLWVSRITQIYLFTLALGLNIHIFYFIILIPVSFVAEIMPISFMGLGVREYTLILLFSLVGISKEASVALGLLIFTFGLLPATLLGYAATIKEYGGIKRLRS